MEQELRVILSDHILLFSCEGVAEREIIEWLLEENKLFCGWEDIVDGGVTGIRKASEITTKFLNVQYDKPLGIIRVHDSKHEKFSLKEVYRKKCTVLDVYTRPEIEALVIIHQEVWSEFCKKRNGIEKPSDYCRQILGFNTKIQGFVRKYFGNIDNLIDSMREYKRIHCGHGEYCLADLLN